CTTTVAGHPVAESTVPGGSAAPAAASGPAGEPDAAALRAIERTGTLPRDTDGRVPSSFIIGLRPQD
ncbi:MAG TPA: protein TolA, partial [Hydrogenophaga sp.]|nr:protein TolA [Hydrogenophaga sp.]